MNRTKIIKIISENGLILKLFDPDIDRIIKISKGFNLGGGKILSYHVEDNDSLTLFSRLVAFCIDEFSEIVIGASNIKDEATAVQYLDAGADFINSPLMIESIARLCNRRDRLFIPICEDTDALIAASELGVGIAQIQVNQDQDKELSSSVLTNQLKDPKLFSQMEIDEEDENKLKRKIEETYNSGVIAIILHQKSLMFDKSDHQSISSIASKTRKIRNWFRNIKGENIFTGIEHVNIYENEHALARQITDWYSQMFGLNVKELPTGFLLEGEGKGGIEVVKERYSGISIAIETSDFDAAIRYFNDRGIEMEEPVYLPEINWVYLIHRDPIGNRVHVVWRKQK